MSYTNPRHEGRLILIPNLQDAFAILHVSEAPRGSIESALEGAESICFINAMKSVQGMTVPCSISHFCLVLMATLGTKRTTTC